MSAIEAAPGDGVREPAHRRAVDRDARLAEPFVEQARVRLGDAPDDGDVVQAPAGVGALDERAHDLAHLALGIRAPR